MRRAVAVDQSEALAMESGVEDQEIRSYRMCKKSN
jgi:hypothetical protein